jgi:uncharacterized protein YuzE
MPHPLSAKLKNHQRIARLSRAKIEALLEEHPLTSLRAPTRDIKLEYDPASDTAYLAVSKGPVWESQKIRGGLIVDFGPDGQIVGIDIPHAMKRFAAALPAKAASRHRKTA